MNYFAGSDLTAARALAASDIFFLVAADITLFFAGAVAFTEADAFTDAAFFIVLDFLAGEEVFAGVTAERTYFRFWVSPVVFRADRLSPAGLFKRDSRICVRRLISLFNADISLSNSDTAPIMLIRSPIEKA
ncbi:hypothetical protein [Tunturiibacter gelidiferens]|uniref:hypothetical protein n=1 Tax=Tunturiibacter gelidiferens TaxID=3069689 RepID=UPI003D9B4F23